MQLSLKPHQVQHKLSVVGERSASVDGRLGMDSVGSFIFFSPTVELSDQLWPHLKWQGGHGAILLLILMSKSSSWVTGSI